MACLLVAPVPASILPLPTPILRHPAHHPHPLPIYARWVTTACPAPISVCSNSCTKLPENEFQQLAANLWVYNIEFQSFVVIKEPGQSWGTMRKNWLWTWQPMLHVHLCLKRKKDKVRLDLFQCFPSIFLKCCICKCLVPRNWFRKQEWKLRSKEKCNLVGPQENALISMEHRKAESSCSQMVGWDPPVSCNLIRWVAKLTSLWLTWKIYWALWKRKQSSRCMFICE